MTYALAGSACTQTEVAKMDLTQRQLTMSMIVHDEANMDPHFFTRSAILSY